MSDIVRWEPFREALTLRDAMNRLLEDSFVRFPWPTLLSEETLAMDMYETDDALVVKAVLPGVNPDDIEINVTGDVLTIRGEIKEEEETEKRNYHYRERRFGSFSRSVALPVPVEADKAEAEFEHGILTLTLPKVEEVKPKVITVKAKKANKK
ncbi:MAG TPA: Hsp20/alpha crystallin family protein [Chloroflexi bacterium]|nr:Hsp20/alpha crystallin family protein [Chloroflexota bacterium]